MQPPPARKATERQARHSVYQQGQDAVATSMYTKQSIRSDGFKLGREAKRSI